MENNQTLLCIDLCGRESYLAKITDNMNQTMISFAQRDGEHITIHRQNDYPRHLFTYSSKHFQSKSGPAKIEAAKAEDYLNPEKHAHYLAHQEIYTDHKIPYLTYNDKGATFEERLEPFIAIPMSSFDCQFPIPNKHSKKTKSYIAHLLFGFHPFRLFYKR